MRRTLGRSCAVVIWLAFRLGLTALAPGAMLLPFQPALADEAATPAFRDGHTDRQAWETWFGGLSGTYRDGAEFWASHRSDPNPPDCSSTNDVAFRSGCEEAQKRLDESDRHRRAEPDYKAGWNSPLDVDTSTNIAAPPAAPTQAPAVLAQAGSDNAVTITITRMVRFITPVNPIIELFTSSAGGRCNYYAAVDNHTPYHIINIDFRYMNSITDIRAMSHDLNDRPMGYFTINAPMLRPDEDGDVHSGDQNYKITGTINGSFSNCEAAARALSDNLYLCYETYHGWCNRRSMSFIRARKFS